jgi:hypothetical protein
VACVHSHAHAQRPVQLPACTRACNIPPSSTAYAPYGTTCAHPPRAGCDAGCDVVICRLAQFGIAARSSDALTPPRSHAARTAHRTRRRYMTRRRPARLRRPRPPFTHALLTGCGVSTSRRSAAGYNRSASGRFARCSPGWASALPAGAAPYNKS